MINLKIILVELFMGMYLSLYIMCLINAKDVIANGLKTHNVNMLVGDLFALGSVIALPVIAIVLIYKIWLRVKPNIAEVKT